MWILAIYDICEPRRLNRVAKILKDYGYRVQKSKFEIEVSDRSFAELRTRIAGVIEDSVDGVKYIPLCDRCRGKTEIIGLGRYVDPDHEFVIV
ncbi:MAG: CRISPR-associated endonuclease Cas2 [Desulfobulbaceae bacterium DB1]|nr:MAG: CRISPR-associated endonuclease Cas2 [Desulfobulbaceae bacterium DB1]